MGLVLRSQDKVIKQGKEQKKNENSENIKEKEMNEVLEACDLPKNQGDNATSRHLMAPSETSHISTRNGLYLVELLAKAILWKHPARDLEAVKQKASSRTPCADMTCILWWM